jgi:hypothetical protein
MAGQVEADEGLSAERRARVKQLLSELISEFGKEVGK